MTNSEFKITLSRALTKSMGKIFYSRVILLGSPMLEQTFLSKSPRVHSLMSKLYGSKLVMGEAKSISEIVTTLEMYKDLTH